MELLRELKSLLAFNSMMRHSFFKRIVSIMLIIVALASTCSCSTSDADATAVSTPSYYQYLGDEAYDSSISAFVCESIEGEEEQGIIYREVTDLNGIVTLQDIKICLYFYTSLASDVHGVTAGVEDLAQYLDGQVIFIAIDAVTERDISTAYEIEALPEFVLISEGVRVSTFEGMNFASWTTTDVANWLESNGVVMN